MKIEVLFNDVCNLYGDNGNEQYLRLCLPEADFIDTPFNLEPYFAKNDVDMVIISSMSETAQVKVIERLLPYRDRLELLIDKGVIFLATGNAYEIFCNEIIDNGEFVDGLKIFPLFVQREMLDRYSGLLKGRFTYNNYTADILGFQAQFTKLCTNQPFHDEPFLILDKDKGRGTFCDVEPNYTYKNGLNLYGVSFHGHGHDEKQPFDANNQITEGIHRNNFFGTSLLAPILPQNPALTKYIMKLLGVRYPKLAFEETAFKAFNRRLSDFNKPGAAII
jgi:CobQ-like glutamine amidotransferase family enzyme